jgi:hypothetical protein
MEETAPTLVILAVGTEMMELWLVLASTHYKRAPLEYVLSAWLNSSRKDTLYD